MPRLAYGTAPKGKGVSGATPCPACTASPTGVRLTNGPRRYRECHKCKHTWTTYEVHEDHYHLLMSVLSLFDKENVKRWIPGRGRQ
jgi:transcriptional regulator NrdR family protein